MAKIQTYDSQVQLSEESPKAQQDPQKMAAPGELVSEAGKTLGELGDYMNKLRDLQQSTAGMHILRQSVQQHYVEAANSADPMKALEKVDENFQKDMEAASKHISSVEGREKFMQMASSYVDRKSIGLQSTLMSKANKLTEASVAKDIDERAKDVISSQPKEHAQAMSDFKAYVDYTKETYPNHQGIQKYYDHVMKTLPEKMFSADIGKWDQIEGDPHPYLQSIQKELQKGDKGWYKDLPPEKKEWAITQTNKAMKQADVKMDYKQRNNQHKADKKATVLFAMGQLTPDKLAESSVGMSRERFDLLNKNRDVITSEEPHPQEFADALDYIHDLSSSKPVDKSTWDKRADGSEKGTGFLGLLKRPDGKVSSEISVGVNIDGKEMEIPTLVPTLSQKERDYLLNDGKPTKEIVAKATAFAKERLAQGKSVFADDSESPQKKGNTERESLDYVLQKMNEGKLTAQEGKDIIKMFTVSPEDDPVFKVPKNATLEQYITSQGDKNAMSEDKRKASGTWWKSLKSTGLPPVDIYNAARKIIGGYNSDNGNDKKDTVNWAASQAKDQIKKSRIEKHPNFFHSLPKEGKVYQGYRYFPDGDAIEES
jgi:hypothetical protein